jgi:hypothetical protein
VLADELKRFFEELVISAQFAEVNKAEFYTIDKRAYGIRLIA